jgi:hypothetical protein
MRQLALPDEGCEVADTRTRRDGMDRRFGFDIDSIVRPEENGNSGNDREIDATIKALEQAVLHAVRSVLQD